MSRGRKSHEDCYGVRSEARIGNVLRPVKRPRSTWGNSRLLSHEHRALIGLDIGSRSVKLVELSGRAPEFELEGIGVSVVDDDESDAAFEHAISSVLEAGTLDTKRVATSVCGPNVAVRSFRFPQLSRSELEGAVWYEGSQVIAFGIQEAYVDFSVLREPSEEGLMTEVLFVAVKKENVDFKTRVLETAGLEPRVVGVDALVLLEALLLDQGLPETVGIIDIGGGRSSIGITKRDSPPFVRDIEIAGDSFTEAVASVLGVSHSEAEQIKLADAQSIPGVARAMETATQRLVAEVRRSLVYYQTRQHGSTVDAMFVCGGASRLPGLPEAIAASTGVDVRTWSPFERVHVDDGRFDRTSVEELAPSMSLAAALAMQQETSA